MSFYKFVNSEWENNNPIPDNESRWGGFVELQHKCKETILKILQCEKYKDTIPVKIYNHYRNIARNGNIDDAMDEYDEIMGLRIYSRFTQANKYGIDCLFHIDKCNDPNDPDIVRMDITPSGLSMAQENYSNEYKVKLFEEHLTNVGKLFKFKDPEIWANKIVSFEKKLATHTMTTVQSRRYMEYMNVVDMITLNVGQFMELKSLPEKNTFICDSEAATKLLEQFKGILSHPQKIIIYDGDGFRARLDMMNHEYYEQYMQYKVIQSFKEVPELEPLMFDFYDQKLKGVGETKFDDRIINILNKLVPDQLGQLYVDYVSVNQHALNDMVKHIIEESVIFVQNSNFSDSTKEEAVNKIRNLKIKIGAPDVKIENYSFRNIWEVHAHNYHKLFTKFDRPVDRNDWSLSPHIVNARSIWSQNEIIFPTALMQYPMFVNNINEIGYTFPGLSDHGVLTAVNYGAIGCIIAHEITHALDDRGRNYDSNGAIRRWMTDSDMKVFENNMNIIREQIADFNENSTYKIEESKYKINPDLVMTEVMADIGGIQISFSAMKKLFNITTPTKEDHVILKLFFESFARALRLKMRPEIYELSLKVNPHAPVEFRANLLKNIPEFHEVYPQFSELKNRVNIWK